MSDTTTDIGRELAQAQEELRLLRGLYLAVLSDTMTQTQLLVGEAGTGDAPAAYNRACDLMQSLSTRKHQFKMRQEQAGANRYDLAALGVDASVPTDSETGFEDRG